MKRKGAQVLSILFQPLLMPTFLCLVLFAFASSSLPPWTFQTQLLVAGLILLTTCIVPLVSLVLLNYTNGVKDFFMEDRKQRVLPFFFIAFYYALSTYLFTTKQLTVVADVLIACLATITALIMLLSIITIFWKISAHGIGMGGSVGVLFAIQLSNPMNNLYWPIVVLSVISGFVLSARLYLNVHKPAEVWAGFSLGLIFSFISITYLIS